MDEKSLLQAVKQRYKVSGVAAKELSKQVKYFLEANGFTHFIDDVRRSFGKEYAANFAVEIFHRRVYEAERRI